MLTSPIDRFKLGLSALCLILSGALHAQSLEVMGRMKVDGGDLNDAKITVMKDGKKVKVLDKGLSRFDLSLDLQSDYMLIFEKPGYITKKLSFNTRVPAESANIGFAPFDFVVAMFKQYDDINIVVFNQPVGMIRYEPDVEEFDYDTDYTKSIQSQLDDAMAAIEEKDKEAAKEAKEEEKRLAAEEKQQAKLAAEEAKREAELAKEREKAEEQRLAEEQKAAEERRREEERLAEEARKAAEAVEPEPDPAPQPPAKPDPVAAVEPPPRPKPQPPPPVIQSNGTLADANSGSDGRRSITHQEGFEESPVRPAEASTDKEIQPEVIEPEILVDRKEDLIVEPTKIIKVVVLDNGEEKVEFRKITHKWGGTYYFKNGLSCSQQIYELEAMAE